MADKTFAMPELPEVETVRLGSRPALEGRTIMEAQDAARRSARAVSAPFRRTAHGPQSGTALAPRQIILAELDSGETLVIHLGMSGRMSVYAEGKQQQAGRLCL